MTLARLTLEFLTFGLGLVIPLWASQGWVFTHWMGLVVIAIIYLVLGATPSPWIRRPLLVGVAAFLVPFGLLGWISWWVEYRFLVFFERSAVWPNLPRVLFGSENLAVATCLSGVALGGHSLRARVWRR